ncbi:MAG: hypothetical protein M3044_06385 [Thermoproteota archaeon]|nr:hypothetical protein [Thermoproteota archaeon]
MYHISYSKYEDTWSVPLTIFASKKKETSRCQNNWKILEKMILKILEKLQKMSKSCKNQTCFFDYTNESLMTDFAPRTPGLGWGAAAAYFGIKICQ